MGSSQPTATSFGELLRRWRREAGLTQEALAERAGLSVRGVSDLERGHIRKARRGTVQMLANALQLGPQARAAFEVAARVAASVPAPLSARYAPLPAVAQSPTFVGRAQEVARIVRHLAAADHLAAPVLFFAGEPGIGKTRLLHEAAVRATAAGWQVLAGDCTRRSGQEPYAPIADMLARSIAHQSPAEQCRQMQGCAWLVRLLPELLETAVVPAPAWSLPPEQERRLMFAAVARYLANVAGPSGTLLLLDDLQWAGADALDLFESLARRAAEAATREPPAPRLRIIAAYRSTEADPQHPLAAIQADLVRTGLAIRSVVGPLSPADANALAQDLLADIQAGKPDHGDLVERLIWRAGGIPFYLVNCAQAMRAGALDGGGMQEETAARRASTAAYAEETPWAVAEIIRQRVAALAKQARDLLAVAAVIGRVVPHAVLEAAMAAAEPQSEGEFLPALDAACRAHLLMEREEAQEPAGHTPDYQFAHDLIHEVILRDIGTARRVRLHRVVATALECMSQAKGTREKVAAELAVHFLHAQEPARALPYALLAGDQAEVVYAHTEAGQHYRTAADLAHELGDVRREAQALEKLGWSLLFIQRPGTYREAAQILTRAFEAYRALKDIESQARALARSAFAHVEVGSTKQGLAYLESQLQVLEHSELSQIGQTELYLALGTYHLFLGRSDDMHTAGLRAEQLALAAGDRRLIARAVLMVGQALINLDRPGEGLPLVAEAAREAEAIGDLWVQAHALHQVVHAHVYLGYFAAGMPHAERALELWERIGDLNMRSKALGWRAWMEFGMGEWKRARADIELAQSVRLQLGANFMPQSIILPGLDFLRAGDSTLPARIAHDLGRARDSGIELDNTEQARLAKAEFFLAERDLLAGRAVEARSRLETIDRSVFFFSWDMSPSPLAWAYMETGAEAEAEVMLADLMTHSRGQDNWLMLTGTLRMWAMLCVRRGRWVESEQALDESLELCRRMPSPYAEAKALYVYGQLHTARNESDLAEEKHQAALAICKRLGEGLYRQHIERALADLPG